MLGTYFVVMMWFADPDGDTYRVTKLVLAWTRDDAKLAARSDAAAQYGDCMLTRIAVTEVSRESILDARHGMPMCHNAITWNKKGKES